MSSLVVIFILFLSLPISSCEGRRLRSHMKDLSTPFPHSSKQHDAKMQHDRESLDSTKPIETSSKGVETDEVQVGATIERPEGSEEWREAVDEERKAVSGGEGLKPSYRVVSPQRNHIKVWLLRKRERLLLGIESNEEHIGSKESRTVAELVSMDYPMPHRGPSIHNR